MCERGPCDGGRTPGDHRKRHLHDLDRAPHWHVHEQGGPTTYYFEWGTTTAYGQTTTETAVPDTAPDGGGCSGCVPISADLSGLPEGTTYHHRVVAKNASVPEGVFGIDRTIATQTPIPPPTDTDATASPTPPTAATPTPARNPITLRAGPPPPPQNTDGPKPPTPDDLDADGVPDTADMCPKSGSVEKVDADGCGPFNGRAGFAARSTLEIQDDPGVSLQCNNNILLARGREGVQAASRARTKPADAAENANAPHRGATEGRPRRRRWVEDVCGSASGTQLSEACTR